MGAMLEDGVHCMWYRNLDDSLNRARSLLSDPELRNTIRIEGEKFVRANHTYDLRVPFLLEDREWVNPL